MSETAEPSPGRPTDYSPEIVAVILARIAEGESVRSIARDEAMPAMSTIFKWLAEHEEFSEQYRSACEMRADAMFEEMFEIADDGTNDWMERHNQDGQSLGWVLNSEHVQRSRLRVDTRKWALSKMQPKKYGDKVQHVGGDESDAPIRVASVVRTIVDPKTDRTEHPDAESVPPASGA